ncbi:ferrous iron transporter B, partial [Actinomyces polynesiensis]|uniref:ferrous iron transporter B n=1 Tax=Actinomyces polynesiensis TaxID=1325934 RepID=UPI0005BC2063
IFAWVDGVEAATHNAREDAAKLSRSDRIDRLLLHPLVGIPVFFALMWLLFKIAGEWVGPVQDFFDGIFSSQDEGAFSLANGLDALLGAVGLGDSWVHGLLVGGLCTGLGVVASFLPLMFVIFLMISILEDSGYMARAAFLGDRVMRSIGLDGRVILPLIMGFGCNLPSLAATRTLPNAKQRLVTSLIIPYTSCAARLTIYLMIARIFFPSNTGTVVFGLYLLSLVMVVVGALVLRPFINRESSNAPLMLVLPSYQMPRVVVTLKSTALRSWSFVKGAGKIIVTMTLVVWFMSAIPVAAGHSFADPELPMEDSLYGRTAQVLVPVFEPTGFGEWHMTGALMTGFIAKETVISSIVTSYNMDPETQGGDAEDGGTDLGSLPDLVRGSFEKSAGDAAPLAAFAFLVFVLTYTPCLATVAEQARQIGGRRTATAVAVQLAAAWVLATAIFQIGRLFL